MDPISPELVLIDPELARRARARLPGPRDSNGKVTPGRPQARPPRALRLRFVVAAGGLFVILLGVLIRPIGSGTSPAPSEVSVEEQPAPGLPRTQASVGSSLIPAGRGIQKEGGHAVRGSDHASAKSETERRRSKAPRKGSSAQPGPTAGARATDNRVATRLFVWLPSPGARFYNVRFLRQARTVFEAWPTDPRVTVPIRGTFRGRKFAFTNGRYRWIVRPALGPRSRPRYGEPIVRSVWVVRDGAP